MTDKEKQLVIKDLAARLPYNVIVHNSDPEEASVSFLSFLNGEMFDRFKSIEESYDLRPYLRSYDDMTKEEAKELKQLGIDHTISTHGKLRTNVDGFYWFISKMFDINQLIPKGLAYPASPSMYTIQTGHK